MEKIILVIAIIAIVCGVAWIALAFLEPLIDRVGNKVKDVVLKEYVPPAPLASLNTIQHIPIAVPTDSGRSLQFLRAGVIKSVDRRGRTIYRRNGRIISRKEAVQLEVK